jgi:hypothetical protein
MAIGLTSHIKSNGHLQEDYKSLKDLEGGHFLLTDYLVGWKRNGCEPCVVFSTWRSTEDYHCTVYSNDPSDVSRISCSVQLGGKATEAFLRSPEEPQGDYYRLEDGSFRSENVETYSSLVEGGLKSQRIDKKGKQKS